MRKLQRTIADTRENQLKVNALSGQAARVTDLGAVSKIDLQPIVTTPPPSAVNQIRNGDFGHSVNTWFEAAPSATNKDKECAFWYSHDAPTNGQRLDESNSKTDLNIDGDANAATNKELKTTSHSTYNADYCDWIDFDGYARLTGTKTLDAPMPSNVGGPGKIESVGMIIARADIRSTEGSSAVIIIRPTCRIYCGFWDNTAGQRDWLKAQSFSLSGSTQGTPVGTTERRYKIFAKTDRGYNFLSDELVVTDAPDDDSFVENEVYVQLAWQPIEGILEYDVYRYNVVANTYQLLKDIGNGSVTYIDNNSAESVSPAPVAYPTATDSVGKAYVATKTNELVSVDGLQLVAINGVDGAWDSAFFNVPIPGNYFQNPTTDKQWFRAGMTEPLDRQVTDAVVVAIDKTLTSEDADFTSRDVGRTITLTKGTNTFTAMIDSVTAENEIEMDSAPDWGDTGVTLLISEGGEHGLLVDLVHSSYVAGSVFSPHPDDYRLDKGGQQPIARPDGSFQGGVGRGGRGGAGQGGLGGCIALDVPVLTRFGNGLVGQAFQDIHIYDVLEAGNLQPNRIMKKRTTTAELYLLQTDNGIELPCSLRHPVITSQADEWGQSVGSLEKGDSILTWKNGRVERARFKRLIKTGKVGTVGTFELFPGHLYLAGRPILSRWRRFINWLFRSKPQACAVFCHNLKNQGGQGD